MSDVVRLSPPRVRPPPFGPMMHQCVTYSNVDIAAATIAEVLAEHDWQVTPCARIATWRGSKRTGDGGELGMKVRLYAWPTSKEQEGGLVEIMRTYGARGPLGVLDDFDRTFHALKRRCDGERSAL